MGQGKEERDQQVFSDPGPIALSIKDSGCSGPVSPGVLWLPLVLTSLP
jgi:hypothetical protein